VPCLETSVAAVDGGCLFRPGHPIEGDGRSRCRLG
jgi:hypothetical protein